MRKTNLWKKVLPLTLAVAMAFSNFAGIAPNLSSTVNASEEILAADVIFDLETEEKTVEYLTTTYAVGSTVTWDMDAASNSNEDGKKYINSADNDNSVYGDYYPEVVYFDSKGTELAPGTEPAEAGTYTVKVRFHETADAAAKDLVIGTFKINPIDVKTDKTSNDYDKVKILSVAPNKDSANAYISDAYPSAKDLLDALKDDASNPVKFGANNLVYDQDFTATASAKNGVITATITFKGNYTGVVTATADISKSIANTNISVTFKDDAGKDVTSPKYVKGDAWEASDATIKITDGNKVLSSPADYSVADKKTGAVPGEAVITITGAGLYANSTVDVTYTVAKGDIKEAMIDATVSGIKHKYDGEGPNLTTEVALAPKGATYTTADFTVVPVFKALDENSKPTGKFLSAKEAINVGKYQVYAAGSGKYYNTVTTSAPILLTGKVYEVVPGDTIVLNAIANQASETITKDNIAKKLTEIVSISTPGAKDYPLYYVGDKSAKPDNYGIIEVLNGTALAAGTTAATLPLADGKYYVKVTMYGNYEGATDKEDLTVIEAKPSADFAQIAITLDNEKPVYDGATWKSTAHNTPSTATSAGETFDGYSGRKVPTVIGANSTIIHEYESYDADPDGTHDYQWNQNYTVEYESEDSNDCIAAGRVTVTVKATGSKYYGEKTLTFDIAPATLTAGTTDSDFLAEDLKTGTSTYDGEVVDLIEAGEFVYNTDYSAKDTQRNEIANDGDLDTDELELLKYTSYEAVEDADGNTVAGAKKELRDAGNYIIVVDASGTNNFKNPEKAEDYVTYEYTITQQELAAINVIVDTAKYETAEIGTDYVNDIVAISLGDTCSLVPYTGNKIDVSAVLVDDNTVDELELLPGQNDVVYDYEYTYYGYSEAQSKYIATQVSEINAPGLYKVTAQFASGTNYKDDPVADAIADAYIFVDQTIKTEEYTVARLYNPSNGDHFYTASAKEAEAAAKGGYKIESKSYLNVEVNEGKGVDVYRMYCPASGDHFYTTNKKEYDAVKAGGAYNAEGVAFKAAEGKSGVPVYRLYCATNGDHFYTKSVAEVAALAAGGVYKYEGVAFYMDK